MNEWIYQRLKRWAQSQTTIICGVPVYGWRHSLMVKCSSRYDMEYDAEIQSALEKAFAGLDCSGITAGTIDASVINASFL